MNVELLRADILRPGASDNERERAQIGWLFLKRAAV